MFRVIILGFALIPFSAFSSVSVVTGAGADFAGTPSGAVAPSIPTAKIILEDTILANIQASCLDTNSRWGGNPLISSATHIVVALPYVDSSNNDEEYLIFEFPASIVRENVDPGNTPTKIYKSSEGTFDINYRSTEALASGGSTDELATSTSTSTTYQLSSDNRRISIQFLSVFTVQDSTRPTLVKQLVGGSLVALNVDENRYSRDNGRSTGSTSATYTSSSDESLAMVELSLSVPVASDLGGCRYFTSPLMVFFDKRRPQFTGLSSFSLVEGSYVNWPERNSPGYFIALDQNNDGKISKAYELFGNKGLKGSYKNGFEALKVYDTNKDKKIDKKDEVFHKLVLWKDLNRNGVGEKKEQISLSSKIKSISLNYKESQVKFGNRARELQSSSFIFLVDDKGKKREQKGHVGDIWFASISKDRVSVVVKGKDGKLTPKKKTTLDHLKMKKNKKIQLVKKSKAKKGLIRDLLK